MTAFPHEEWGTPTDSLLRSVVLQHLDTELPSLPRLGSNDLSWREVADALWLAHRLTPEADRGERDEPPTDPGEPSLPPLDQTGSDLPPVAPDRESGAQDWTPGPTQFIHPSVLDSDPAREAAPLRWPSAPTLPGALGIARALRPLMKTTQSPWKHVLDEEATATRAAQDSMWLPVWRPAPWHRLELALVVDTSPSMEIWRRTVEEFRQLLRRQGAFRDVRTYLVDCSNDTDDELVLHMEGPSGRPRSWRDLVDPTGRRLVLVLTDAVGMAWRNGCASRTLARWANRMPVAVGHLLPQRLWSWGGLSPQRTRLSAAAPGVPNRRLRMHSVDSGQILDDARSPVGVVVPVLSLTPEWLSGWARLVAGVDGVSVETTAVVVHEGAADNGIAVESVEPESAEPGGACTPRERVLRFRTFASAEAFQLAGLLAAAPLNLPMMRLVQRVLLPGSGLPAVAEVLLGGILRKVPTSSSADDASAVVFEFYDGVRQELLSGERRDNTVRVARVLGDYAGRHLAVLRDYRDAVDDPDTAVDPELSAHTVPYLRVQEVVFRALSGRYARRAGVLRRSLDQWSHDGGTDSTERVIQASGNIHGAPLGVVTPEVESDRQSVSIHDIGGVAVTATESTPLTDTSTVASSRSGEGNMTASSPSITVSQERGMSGRPQIWGAIPLRNPDFVGRIDLLEQLQTRLTEPGTTVVLPEALHGMGGVGKSQTVVEYIYLHANEYDIIWWVPAEQPSQITNSFVQLATRLGVSAAGSADTAVPAVLEALRKGEVSDRWLLVFDNADRPDDLRPFFPAGTGHIIVTSRNSQWSTVARTVEVDLFTREESKELLRRRGGEITDAEAEQLAGALGDLPLAIEQAAAWRAQTGMPVAEYLELLDQNLAELMEQEQDTDYQRSVAAAWNVPLNRLRTEHPAALQMLEVCAFFGPEPISRSLFTGVRAAPVPDELARALSDPIKLNRSIREISRYSLAKIDHRNNTLQLHRLVQTVLKSQLSDEERDVMRHAVHILLVHGDPDDPESSETWPRYSALLPHATISNAIECPDGWVRRLVINLVRYLLNVGDFEGARQLAVRVHESWLELLGEDEPDTLTMARLYGRALWRLGRLKEARTLNQQTLERVRVALGEDHEIYLSVADSVSGDRRSQGLFFKELEVRRDVLEGARRIHGDDDPATLAYANNLAGTLRLVGEFFQARDLDEDTWRRKTIVLGEEHPDTLLTLNALAMDLRECGQYLQACQLQEETLVRQRKILGDDHPRTIGAIRNLAVARRKAGDHVGARQLSEDCLARYRRRHGEKHLGSITAEMCVSADLRHLDDLPQSRHLGERSYRMFGEAYGERHPFTLIAATNLAIVLRLSGRVGEARELNEKAMTALRETFGNDHPFALVCATNLASDLAELGDSAAGHELDKDTFERSARTLGQEHPSTLAVALNLSIDLTQLGSVDEAAILHTRTVASFHKVLGDDHPATVAARQSLRANCDTDTMQL